MLQRTPLSHASLPQSWRRSVVQFNSSSLSITQVVALLSNFGRRTFFTASTLHASSPPSTNEASSYPRQCDGYTVLPMSPFGEVGPVGLPSTLFATLSKEPFSPEITAILTAPVAAQDVEIKTDGIVYLPEIKYRRILTAAFGAGGWGMLPISHHSMSGKTLSREWALLGHGRLIAIARGEHATFGQEDAMPVAAESIKSNALMRACKDLTISSSLWDPVWIREFKAKHCHFVFAYHVSSGMRKGIWKRLDRPVEYPFSEKEPVSSRTSAAGYKKL